MSEGRSSGGVSEQGRRIDQTHKREAGDDPCLASMTSLNLPERMNELSDGVIRPSNATRGRRRRSISEIPDGTFVTDAHSLVRDTVIDVCDVLARELHLAQAMNEWASRLDFLGRVSSVALVDQRLRDFAEPARFLYSEATSRMSS